jgi:hypothetical protein
MSEALPAPARPAAAVEPAAPTGTSVAPAAPATGQPAPEAKPAQPAAPDFQSRMRAEQEKRAAQARERETETLRARLASLEVQAKEADTLRAWREGVKRDPSALKEVLGDNWYDVITEHRLSGGRLTPEQVEATVNSKIEALEAKRAAEKAEQEKATAEERATQRSEWVADLTAYMQSDDKAYKLINKHNQHAAVADWIERNYRETGKLATNAEGAAAVEGALRKAVLDSVDEELLQEILKSRQPASPPASASREAPKSLHNGLAASTPTTPPRLSRDQRRAQVVKKLEEMEAAGKAGA